MESIPSLMINEAFNQHYEIASNYSYMQSVVLLIVKRWLQTKTPSTRAPKTISFALKSFEHNMSPEYCPTCQRLGSKCRPT